MTGQLEEEKMQVYVRLGIRLLYKVGVLLSALVVIPEWAAIVGCFESYGRWEW